MTNAERALLLAVAKAVSNYPRTDMTNLWTLIAAVEAESNVQILHIAARDVGPPGNDAAPPSDEDRAIKYISDNERHFAADARYLLSKAAPPSEPSLSMADFPPEERVLNSKEIDHLLGLDAPPSEAEQRRDRQARAERNGVTEEQQEIADRFDAKGRLEAARKRLEQEEEMSEPDLWDDEASNIVLGQSPDDVREDIADALRAAYADGLERAAEIADQLAQIQRTSRTADIAADAALDIAAAIRAEKEESK